MKVKDVMHKGVDWVSPETPITEIARLMREHDIGSIPIGEDDHLIGMVTDRVVIRAKTPDDIEFVVDPIEGPDETKPSEWIFNRRFQIEQHIPLGWVKREQN